MPKKNPDTLRKASFFNLGTLQRANLERKPLCFLKILRCAGNIFTFLERPMNFINFWMSFKKQPLLAFKAVTRFLAGRLESALNQLALFTPLTDIYQHWWNIMLYGPAVSVFYVQRFCYQCLNF